MSVTANGSTRIEVAYDIANAGVNTLGTARDRYQPAAYSISWASGAGANAFNKAFSAGATLAATGVDLVLSSLATPLGAIAPAAAKEVAIFNDADPAGSSSNALTVGGAASHPWTNGVNGTVTIPPGGALVLTAPTAAGIAIASGSNDQLRLTTAGAVPYRVELKLI